MTSGLKVDRRVKERIVGAVVLLILLGVIFIPLMRDDKRAVNAPIAPAAVPPRPDVEFSTRLIPMPERGDILPAEQTEGASATPPASPSPDEAAARATGAVTADGKAAGPRAAAASAAADNVPAAVAAAVAPATAATAPPAAAPSAGTGAGSETQDGAGASRRAPPAPASSPPAAIPTGWVVQVGSFSRENADKLNVRLRDAKYPSYIDDKPVTSRDGAQVYRVRVGPVALRSEANKLNAELKQDMQLDGMVLEFP